MNWLIEKRTLIIVICALLPTAIVGFIACHQTSKIIKSSEKLSHSQQVHDELDDILSLCKDVETGGRGFALTGKDEFLQPYFNATSELDKHFRHLSQLTRNNSNMQEKLIALDASVDKKIEQVEKLVLTRKQKGFEAAGQLVSTGTGRKIMENIRRQVKEMDDEEDRFMQTISGQSEDSNAQTLRVSTILAVFALALIGCNVFFARLPD
jgi:CHASE3 domain sensor protein